MTINFNLLITQFTISWQYGLFGIGTPPYLAQQASVWPPEHKTAISVHVIHKRPPSETDWTAPSINGEAEPYGSFKIIINF